MITRCPSCGASNSLDALVNDAEAVRLLTHIFQQNEVGAAFLRYLALHRPRNRALTNERIAKLLNEILPDFEKGEIQRNGKPHPAPKAAWLWAINEAIKARDNATLIPPLKGHGYLYEVITRWKPEPLPAPRTPAYHSSPANDDYAPVSVSKTFKSAAPHPKVRPALKGIDPKDMLSHIAKHRQPGESGDECYQRLLQEQEQQGETP